MGGRIFLLLLILLPFFLISSNSVSLSLLFLNTTSGTDVWGVVWLCVLCGVLIKSEYKKGKKKKIIQTSLPRQPKSKFLKRCGLLAGRRWVSE